MASTDWMTDYAKYLICDPTTINITPMTMKEETPVDPKVREQAEKLAKAEAAAKLFPFPGTNWNDENEQYTHCPKCGRRVFRARFRVEDASSPEHLRWECGCEYTWLTKTKDAE